MHCHSKCKTVLTKPLSTKNSSYKKTWLIFLLAFNLSRETASSAAFFQRVAVGQEDADEGSWEEGEPVATLSLPTSTKTFSPETLRPSSSSFQIKQKLVFF